MVPPLSLPWFACLRARAVVWALLACVRLARGGRAGWGGTWLGRDMVVPPRTVWRVVSGCCVWGVWCVGCSQGANASARSQRGGGRGVGCLVAACVWGGRVGGEGLGVLPRVVNTILLRSPTWERVPPLVGAGRGVSGASWGGRLLVWVCWVMVCPSGEFESCLRGQG